MGINGKITKILANFYYVQDSENKIWECFARARLLKEGKLLFVGDAVKIEASTQTQGVIVDVIERKNKIDKPPVANIDQVLVTFSTTEPEFDLYNLDRYLSYISYELPGGKIRICLNKIDLKEININEIYKNSGFEISYISALTKKGINELSNHITGKITVLAGPSGVGKTSLIKAFAPELDIKIGPLSSIKTGKHETRNVQLLQVKCNGEKGYFIDTPGFTQFSFAALDSYKVLLTFKELDNINCNFNNCLHDGHEGCNVHESIKSGNVSETRYKNYLKIREELKSEVVYGTKQETKVKSVGGINKAKTKILPKIEQKQRAKSRKKEKQELLNFENGFEDIIDE